MTQIQKHKEKRKKANQQWVTIVIHGAMRAGEQWFPHTL